MKNRELENILLSGEISSIYMGGIHHDSEVLDRKTIKAMITAASGSFHSFDFQKEGIGNGGKIDVVSDTYVDVCKLVTPHREAGTYMVSFANTFTYSKTTKSAHFRTSTDGGTNWQEIRIEIKDTTNLETQNLIYPGVFSSGVHELIIQAKVEATGDTLSIHYSDIVFERKQ